MPPARARSARQSGTGRRSREGAVATPSTRQSRGSPRCGPRASPTPRAAGRCWVVRCSGRGSDGGTPRIEAMIPLAVSNASTKSSSAPGFTGRSACSTITGLLVLRALAPRHLLQLEGVAVRIGEVCSPDAASEVVDLADLHPSSEELSTRLVDVLHHQVQASDTAGSPRYTSSPVPKPSEQCEPSGVTWTTRTPSLGCTSTSFMKPSLSA